jgi:hypothetical protein
MGIAIPELKGKGVAILIATRILPSALLSFFFDSKSMVANLKLSPMSAYKIRKILLTSVDQNQLFDDALNPETFDDIDQRLMVLYSESERTLKIRELEALATCYQNLFSGSVPQNQDVQELKRQILCILQPEGADSPSGAASSGADLKGAFEAKWLSSAHCQTIADTLKILNGLLKTSGKYIGPQIAQRTILSTQPEDDWLSQFLFQDKALTYDGATSEVLSNTQRRILQQWVGLYIDFCSSILSNFRTLLEKDFVK